MEVTRTLTPIKQTTMRTRNEILNSVGGERTAELNTAINTLAILELLLDIRDLLIDKLQ